MSKTWYGHYIETIKGTDYVLFKDYIELDKEIERLNKEIIGLNNCIIEFHSEFCNKQAEINRLNNIINELEKWLKEEVEATVFDYHFAIEDVLNKLQELKGDGK